MSPEKVLEVIDIYREALERIGVGAKSHNHNTQATSPEAILEHCHQMLDQMERFVAEGRMEKTFRWLGFVQGCLWSQGVFTIGEMANHNRPDSDHP